MTFDFMDLGPFDGVDYFLEGDAARYEDRAGNQFADTFTNEAG